MWVIQKFYTILYRAAEQKLSPDQEISERTRFNRINTVINYFCSKYPLTPDFEKSIALCFGVSVQEMDEDDAKRAVGADILKRVHDIYFRVYAKQHELIG